MKKKIKKLVQFILDPLVQNLGYQKVSISLSKKNELLENLYTTIIKMGFKPSHIVDVGANHGTWTRKALKYFPNAKYTLIEPQKWLKSSIDDILKINKNISFHGVGAGSKRGYLGLRLLKEMIVVLFAYLKVRQKKEGMSKLMFQLLH